MQVISSLETGVLEPEQSLTSCISSHNQPAYKDPALPHTPRQIVVPASVSLRFQPVSCSLSLCLTPPLTLFSSPCSPGCSAPASVSEPHLLSADPLPRIQTWLCILVTQLRSSPATSTQLGTAPDSPARLPPGYRLPARRTPGSSPAAWPATGLLLHLASPE